MTASELLEKVSYQKTDNAAKQMIADNEMRLKIVWCKFILNISRSENVLVSYFYRL